MTVPQKKYELIAETEKEIVKIDRQYRRGLITNDERYRLSVEAWDDTTKKVTTALQESMDRYNPIFMMPTPAPVAPWPRSVSWPACAA